MANPGTARRRKSAGASLLLPGAVGLLALPSAVLALTSRYEALPDSGGTMETVVTGKLDPRLARSISVRALARDGMFHFTPANQSTQPLREITVAVLSSGVAHSILVRAPEASVPTSPEAPVRIAPMAYNLGVARGYKGFAPSVPRPAIRQIDMPDLASFRSGDNNSGPAARLQPHIEFDERANAGRVPRTFEGDGEQTVDVGGAYRVGRNLDVTAGVRYSQQRDRLRPVDSRNSDGQAVYVGTQFRF